MRLSLSPSTMAVSLGSCVEGRKAKDDDRDGYLRARDMLMRMDMLWVVKVNDSSAMEVSKEN
jgi:hypothetical protein